MWLNDAPTEGRVSDTIRQHEIISITNPNLNNHCRTPFGSYYKMQNYLIKANTIIPVSAGLSDLDHQGIYKGDIIYSTLSHNSV